MMKRILAVFATLLVCVCSIATVSGADTSTRSASDRRSTAMHRAVKLRKLNVLTALLRGGANPNALNASGRTPLHYAVIPERGGAEDSSLQYTRVLLAYGASGGLEDDNGFAPIDIAIRLGNQAVVDALLEQGVNPSRIGPGALSLLTTARSLGRSDIAAIIENQGGRVGTSPAEARFAKVDDVAIPLARNLRRALIKNGDNPDQIPAVVRQQLVESGLPESQVELLVDQVRSKLKRKNSDQDCITCRPQLGGVEK